MTKRAPRSILFPHPVGFPILIITDDELHDLFVQCPPGVLLEVYLDTCHSGTGVKALDLMPDRRPKVNADLKAGHFDQVAQLECDAAARAAPMAPA